MPCSAISNPSISSSFVTLNPTYFFSSQKKIKAKKAAHIEYANAPITCVINWSGPAPLKRPIGPSASMPHRPITIVPQTPTTP